MDLEIQGYKVMVSIDSRRCPLRHYGFTIVGPDGCPRMTFDSKEEALAFLSGLIYDESRAGQDEVGDEDVFSGTVKLPDA